MKNKTSKPTKQRPFNKHNVIGSAYLVLMRLDYAPYRVVVFAKTEQCALGKAKRRFPDYEILNAEYIRHCL